MGFGFLYTLGDPLPPLVCSKTKLSPIFLSRYLPLQGEKFNHFFLQLNRCTLSRLNVAQLQLIQNDHLAQIETLNEELVGLLVIRDELGMEQDAMLTDIEDLSEFINIEKA